MKNGYSKATRLKIEFATEALKQAGITPEAVTKALQAFKEKYPKVDPLAIISYVLVDGFDSITTEATTKFRADYEPEYPTCPNCTSNDFEIVGKGKSKKYVCNKCGTHYRWDQKMKHYIVLIEGLNQ